jgi:hypothetical protein
VTLRSQDAQLESLIYALDGIDHWWMRVQRDDEGVTQASAGSLFDSLLNALSSPFFLAIGRSEQTKKTPTDQTLRSADERCECCLDLNSEPLKTAAELLKHKTHPKESALRT